MARNKCTSGLRSRFEATLYAYEAGQASRYEHVEPGFNSRLDPLQAVTLQLQLPDE